MPLLSLRLKTIADSVKKGAKVCDVGTDHGRLAIYLKKSGTADSVIATDINEKPLLTAKRNIENARVKGIELRLCDGLSLVNQNEADTIIIAGIGGNVISGILDGGRQFFIKDAVTFILQPTTSPEILRRFLCENGFEITEEKPVFENNKAYSVMLCRYTGNKAETDDAFYYVGKVKPETQSGIQYIKKQQKRCFEKMNALKDDSDKADIYLKYKKIYEDISGLL